MTLPRPRQKKKNSLRFWFHFVKLLWKTMARCTSGPCRVLQVDFSMVLPAADKLPHTKGPHGFSSPFTPVVLGHLTNNDTTFRILVITLWVCICQKNLMESGRSQRKMAGGKVGNNNNNNKKLILVREVRSAKCV